MVDENSLSNTQMEDARNILMTGSTSKLKQLAKPVLQHLCDAEGLQVLKAAQVMTNPLKDDLTRVLMQWVSASATKRLSI